MTERVPDVTGARSAQIGSSTERTLTPREERLAGDFARVLAQAGVHISEHAQRRIARAGLEAADGERMRAAIETAERKGITNAAVLLDDFTFIVSVENRTLITAVSDERAKDDAFTGIDGLVKA